MVVVRKMVLKILRRADVQITLDVYDRPEPLAEVNQSAVTRCYEIEGGDCGERVKTNRTEPTTRLELVTCRLRIGCSTN